MSIIHDALKKVQASLQQKTPPAAAPAAPASGAPPVYSSPVVPPPDPVVAQPARPQPEKVQVLAPKNPPNIVFLLGLFIVILIGVWLTYKPNFDFLNFNRMKTWMRAQESHVQTMVGGKKPAQPLAVLKPSGGGPLPVFNIQGIMVSGGKNVALVNDKIYEQGDEISGMQIVSITDKSLTLLKDGKPETIKIGR